MIVGEMIVDEIIWIPAKHRRDLKRDNLLCNKQTRIILLRFSKCCDTLSTGLKKKREDNYVLDDYS